MGARHAFVSAKTDGADTSLVEPSYWNAAHLSPYAQFEMVGTSTLVNSTVTERSTNSRRPGALLVGFTQARLVTRIITSGGNAGNEFRVQWSSDLASWFYLDGSAGPAVVVGNAAGDKTGSWVTLTGVPSTEVTLRIVQTGGNDSTALNAQYYALQLKG